MGIVARKPFWKRSEFWVTVLTGVGGIATAVAGVVTAPVAAVVVSVASTAYAISRGIAKTSGTEDITAEPKA